VFEIVAPAAQHGVDLPEQMGEFAMLSRRVGFRICPVIEAGDFFDGHV
jgi:hypothetical protein